MDEENNNQEQITEEKSQQTAQETSQGVKDGANLAKNVASGNYLGAAKNAVNLAKNKTARRAMIMHAVLSILTPILFVFIAACIVLGVFNAIGDGIQSVIESIGEFFEVDLENDLVIKITDEAIDKMIESIESQGISLDDLHLMGDAADYNDPEVEEKNKEALRKYIREFYEAQAVTQTLYPSPSWYQKFGDKTYGTVYVQRVKPDDTDLSKVTKLKYIKYSDMEKKVTNGAGDIKEYFSINPTTKKLVVPNTTQTIIEVNKKETKNETIIGLTEIDYKSVISQYTTSMNFLVYLTMITQNPEFASAVADLIKDSDIRITIMDKVTTRVTNEERNYIVNTKAIEPKASSYLEGEVTYEEKKGKPVEKTDITNTTVISTTPVPAVNYAKTWFSEQTIQYNKKDEPMQGNSYDTEPYTEPEPSISGEGSSATWITEDVTTVTTSGNIKKYEETSRGDVIDKLGEKGDGKKSFVGLLDVKFRIPNQTRGDKAKESAGGNLVSGAEMFFHLLQKDSNSQNLENIMRYALYKYTGNSYGVTKLDLSIFDIKDFVSIGIKGSTISNYIKSWEDGDLWNYEIGKATTAKNIVTQNGEDYCVVYEDGSNGHNNFAYGIATYISDNNGSENHKVYGKGYYNWSNECNQYGVDVTNLKTGDLIKKDDAFAIFALILQTFEDSVDDYLQRHGISLENHQRDALVAVKYQYGNLGNFAEVYNKYGNTEALRDEFITVQGIKPFTEADSRRSTNWKLFSTGKYIARDGTEIKPSILTIADNIHKYMEQNNYLYCVYFCNNLEEHTNSGECGLNVTFEESMTGHNSSCCATYVSWVLQEAGYLERSEHTDCADDLAEYLYNEKKWEKIYGVDELEPGDVIYYDGHIEIYAGDGKVYNAGSGSAIRGSSPAPKGDGIYGMNYGLRAPN